MKPINYKGTDYTLTVNTKGKYHLIHDNKAFNVKGACRPTEMNALVAKYAGETNDWSIYLNIMRHEYFVVNSFGYVVNMMMTTLNTLDEAVRFAKEYTSDKKSKDSYNIYTFFQDARTSMELKRIYPVGNESTVSEFQLVNKVQPNGFFLSTDNDSCFVALSQNALMDYNKKQLAIYGNAYRLYNEKEKALLDEWFDTKEFKIGKRDIFQVAPNKYYMEHAFFYEREKPYLTDRHGQGKLRHIMSHNLIADTCTRGNLMEVFEVRFR